MLGALQLHSLEAFQIWLARAVEVRDELRALMGEPLTAALDRRERGYLRSIVEFYARSYPLQPHVHLS